MGMCGLNSNNCVPEEVTVTTKQQKQQLNPPNTPRDRFHEVFVRREKALETLIKRIDVLLTDHSTEDETTFVTMIPGDSAFEAARDIVVTSGNGFSRDTHDAVAAVLCKSSSLVLKPYEWNKVRTLAKEYLANATQNRVDYEERANACERRLKRLQK